MMKYVSALAQRLHFGQLQRPQMFVVHAQHSAADLKSGQRIAEQVAGSIGSWAFIGGQACVMAIWVLINSLAFFQVIHFDTYPFVFLNLAMSAEAAFTGPVLLIAANVGAIRDHAQADRVEKLTAQNEQMAEQNTRLVDQMCELEKMVDQHINASAQAHSAEIADLAQLVRSVHSSVTALLPSGPHPAALLASPTPAVAVAAISALDSPDREAGGDKTAPIPAPGSRPAKVGATVPSKRRRDAGPGSTTSRS